MWLFPLPNVPGIPTGAHPGAFGVQRKQYIHTGVDLYTRDIEPRVVAVERGIIMSVEPFTGPQCGSNWWNDTWAVLVQGDSGVVCYGEIKSNLSIGMRVEKGEEIGVVIPVLKDEKYRPDVPGHSCKMLHLELYDSGVYKALDTIALDEKLPNFLKDPTPLLTSALGAPLCLL